MGNDAYGTQVRTQRIKDQFFEEFEFSRGNTNMWVPTKYAVHPENFYLKIYGKCNFFNNTYVNIQSFIVHTNETLFKQKT